MSEKTRSEHLEWAKARALAKIDGGGYFPKAWADFCLDLLDHPELKDHLFLIVGIQRMIVGELNTAATMREFIEGFN